jgi:hypothetical protein
MKVTSISVSVRYSSQQPDGSHKTVEFSATADVDPEEEDWKDASRAIYLDLGAQVNETLSKRGGRNKGPAEEEQPDDLFVDEEPLDALVDSQPSPKSQKRPATPTAASQGQGQHTTAEHWCQDHGTAFKRWEGKNDRAGTFWFSHQVRGSKEWCKEAAE